MKKLFIAVFIALTTTLVTAHLVSARNFPVATGYVNDFANIISDSVQTQLESDLNQHKLNTGQELSVVTLDSLEGDTIENAAVELFSQWGIGTKEKDDGVLLLIAVSDRELRIEVGYGIEPILTDSRTGTIIRDVITPEFKKNDYDTGIKSGVAAILTVLTSDPTAYDYQAGSNSSGQANIFSVLIGFGIIMIYLSAFLARSKSYWPGGVIGAILGFLLSAVTGAILLGLFGFLLDYILSKNYKTRAAKGLPTAWWSSGGGFSSGRSSGGFGGFSGGSSGGGGSSGSW